jgi:hypothetical protein
MAQMLKPGSEHYEENSEHSGGSSEHSISDPCCGSGVMMIATCKTMTNAQLDDTIFVGQDIDITCVMMCALNFVFFNLNGYVILGNSLAGEIRRVFQTIRSYMGGSIIEVPIETIPVPEMKIIEKAVREPAMPKLFQPTLFGQ